MTIDITDDEYYLLVGATGAVVNTIAAIRREPETEPSPIEALHFKLMALKDGS